MSDQATRPNEPWLQALWDQGGSDLRFLGNRRALNRSQLAVYADSRRRTTGEQKVGTTLVPKRLKPRFNRAGCLVTHWQTSFQRGL